MAKGRAVKAVHFDTPEGQKSTAARARVVERVFGGRGAGVAQEVYLEDTGDVAGLAPFPFDSTAMNGIRSR